MTEPDPGREDETRRERVGAVAVLVAALLAVYHPLLRGRAMLYRDLSMWTTPARALVREALARGELPGWNPWESLGFPIPADPLFATFYPPALLTLPLPLSWGTSVYMFLHVAIGAAGLWALARRAGASASACAAGALAWGLAGVIDSEWSCGVRMLTAAWFPWACAAAWDLAQAARQGRSVARPALATAVVGAMMVLTGEVYVTLMAAIPMLGSAVAGAWSVTDASVSGRRALGRSLPALAAAGVVALLLSAPAWLPAARLIGTTARGGAMSQGNLDVWSLHPLLLGDLLLPRGLLGAWVFTQDPSLRALLGENVFYLSLYAGVTAWGLALLAFRRRGGAVAWSALAVAAVGLLLALGRYTPLITALRALVPPFAHMRTPQKFILVAHTPFALLVALGADRALRGASRRPIALVVLALGAAVLFVRAGVSPRVGVMYSLSAVGALLRLGALALALLALRRWGRRAALALPAVLALDVGLNAWMIFGWVDPRAFEAQPPLAGVIRRDAHTHDRGAAPPRLWRSERVESVLGDVFIADVATPLRQRLRAKTNVGTGVAVLPGYDAAVNSNVSRLEDSGRIAAVRLLSADFALLRAATPPPGLTFVHPPAPGLFLYAIDAPLPRAFVAHAAALDAAPPRLSHLLTEPVLTGQVVTLQAAELDALAAREPAPRSPCAITRWAAGDVTLRCEAAARGVAVLVEQWSPGWSATVDGRGAQVLRANRMMLGVPVDAGVHTVRLRFETPGQRASLALGALGLVACAGALAWIRRARRG